MVADSGVGSDEPCFEPGCRCFTDRYPFNSQFNQIVKKIIVCVDYGVHSDFMGMNTLFDPVVVSVLAQTAAEFFVGSSVCDFRSAFKTVHGSLFVVIFHRFFYKNGNG